MIIFNLSPFFYNYIDKDHLYVISLDQWTFVVQIVTLVIVQYVFPIFCIVMYFFSLDTLYCIWLVVFSAFCFTTINLNNQTNNLYRRALPINDFNTKMQRYLTLSTFWVLLCTDIHMTQYTRNAQIFYLFTKQ